MRDQGAQSQAQGKKKLTIVHAALTNEWEERWLLCKREPGAISVHLISGSDARACLMGDRYTAAHKRDRAGANTTSLLCGLWIFMHWLTRVHCKREGGTQSNPCHIRRGSPSIMLSLPKGRRSTFISPQCLQVFFCFVLAEIYTNAREN